MVVDEIERREEGSLFHVRGVCIEKALGWEDERLNNIEDIIFVMRFSVKCTVKQNL